MRWFDYPIGVPFGNPNYDTGLGGSHDMTVLAPPNMAVTSLVSGIVSNIGAPTWGKQVGILLDTPINGIGWFHYLHLSAVNPVLALGVRVNKGDLIGWVGGGNTQADYKGTTNPTGQNFLNTPEMSSRIQVGIALMRGPAYGAAGWQNFPPIDYTLNPTPILEAARKEASMAVDYPGAIDMMLPISYSFTSNAHRKIVDHGTGGNMTLDSLHRTFLDTMRSTHFGIDRDGRVAQFVPLSRGAGGNCCPDRDGQGNPICHDVWLPLLREFGNLNLCTISIEHCNDSNNSLSLTDAQRDASNKLNLWLCERYHLTTNDIHSHASINPVNKARCPGPAFDFDQMFDYINKGRQGQEVGGGPDVFSNDLCIAVWESYFKSIGKPPPPRETGIFRSWRALWISGHFKGCCLSWEYNVTLPNGHAGVAQDYAGGTCVWDMHDSIPTWL